MQQVRFDPATQQTIDVVLFVNGLPLATIELKNAYTHQRATHAIKQYIKDRRPNQNTPLIQFNQRALVHFAADTAECWMTTQLAGEKTYFLPFNQGNHGRKGNPVAVNDYSTCYLWQEVWQREPWLDILQNYILLEKGAPNEPWRKGRLIFPRYHQWQCVRRLVAASRHGSRNYLNQHSAGSGKTHSISWTAHQLSTLHGENNQAVFSGVVVISDRRNLDKQLQDAISSIDRKKGVVECITVGSNESKSAQLRKALAANTRIIVTTLQTFGALLSSGDFDASGRRYAVIVDEAHSSQSGKAAAGVRALLGDAEQVDSEALQDLIVNQIRQRGPQSNLCFYAFTATPKPKTLEMFGDVGADGLPAPFSHYSMRQAIDEGFIEDVLKNYITYSELYEVVKKIPDDPDHDKPKSLRQIMRFATLHEAAVEQKVAIIVEDFRDNVVKTGKIAGKAKAMVVTRSRLHAVRYHRAFEKYVAEKGYTDVHSLVAFSGKLEDEGQEFTEARLNGFEDSKTPERFNTDDYQVLIVADKYQTGFDQPLLHTMYVDKVLGGLQAVQTLSRLNRCHPDKKDTRVVDFVNARGTIYAAFKPYYDLTEIDEATNPNHVYTQQSTILGYGLIRDDVVEQFAAIFFQRRLTRGDSGRLDSLVQSIVSSYNESFRSPATPESEAQGEAFKASIRAFLRLYEFVTQLTRFVDVDLEKFYVFVKHLLSALPYSGAGENEDLSHEIDLERYVAERREAERIELDDGTDPEPLRNPSTGGTGGGGRQGELLTPLSEIVREFNERFGTEFSEQDIRWMEDVEATTEADDILVQQARNSDPSAFKTVYDEKALALLLDHRERSEELFEVLVADNNARGFLFDKMRDAFMRRVIATDSGAGNSPPAGD